MFGFAPSLSLGVPPASMELESPFAPFASSSSLLHRRSRAELEASDEDSDYDDDSDEPISPTLTAYNATSRHIHKRVRLSAEADDALSQPLVLKPPKPQRSRSLGEHLSHSGSSDHSPTMTPTSASSHSSQSFRSASPQRKSGLSILPPSSLARSKSTLILPFSPRSHGAQFLSVPSMQHSPRAALPNTHESPLENLFSQLTMQQQRGYFGQQPQTSLTLMGQRERGFASCNARNGAQAETARHRRSLSISISPTGTPPSCSPLNSPSVDLTSTGTSNISGSSSGSSGGSVLGLKRQSSWLVRVDSAEELMDDASLSDTAATSSSSGPSMLTGSMMVSFFAQLRREYDPDWLPLALAYRWRCQTGGIIYKSEFLAGMRLMQCHTLAELQVKLATIQAELEQCPLADYKHFFAFVFHYLRQSQDGHTGLTTQRKTIGLDIAHRLLLSMLRTRFPVAVVDLDAYFQHLRATAPHCRLTADTWNSLIDFCAAMDVDYVNYAESGSDDAWPTLIDEFLEWLKQTQPARMRRLADRQAEKAMALRSGSGGSAALSPQPPARSAARRSSALLTVSSDPSVASLDPDETGGDRGYEADTDQEHEFDGSPTRQPASTQPSPPPLAMTDD